MAFSIRLAQNDAISSNKTLVGTSLDGKPKENLTNQNHSNNQEQPDFSSVEGQNPQKESYSSPLEKVTILDRIARENQAMEDKLKQHSSMAPSPADMLANQLANQPPMQPSSSPSPSPSPQPSSQPRSSSSNQAVSKTIDSLKASLKKQDQQIASLTKALSAKEKKGIEDIKAPNFGSSRDTAKESNPKKESDAKSQSSETQVAQTKSNEEDISLAVTFLDDVDESLETSENDDTLTA
jgi:hypothetical protein